MQSFDYTYVFRSGSLISLLEKAEAARDKIQKELDNLKLKFAPFMEIRRKQMYLCSKNHEQICHDGRRCPLCESLSLIEELEEEIERLQREIDNA